MIKENDKKRLEEFLYYNLNEIGDTVKLLFQFVDDADLEDDLRELSAGSLLYLLAIGDVIPDKFGTALSYLDDIIIAKLTIYEVLKELKRRELYYKEEYKELFGKVEKELKEIEEIFGKEILDWFRDWLKRLPNITYKGKKAGSIIKNIDFAYWLYDEVNEKLLDIEEVSPQIIKQELLKIDKVLSHLKEKIKLQSYKR